MKFTVTISCPHSGRVIFKGVISAPNADQAVLNGRYEAKRKGLSVAGAKSVATPTKETIL